MNAALLPSIDRGFVPVKAALDAFRAALKADGRDNEIVVRISGGAEPVAHPMRVWRDGVADERNLAAVAAVADFLVWAVGGSDLTVDGSPVLRRALELRYGPGGERAFDAAFMAKIFARPFTVGSPVAAAGGARRRIGGHTDGARIGLDVGGTSVKVAALRDGREVWTEVFPWEPATKADPAYHIGHLRRVIDAAADKLGGFDALGVSTAGVCIDRKLCGGIIYDAVPPDAFERQVRTLFPDLARAYGVAVEVANDGDVAALAGALDGGLTRALGTSLGTSQAGGFVDAQGSLNGWLNELAFVPCDASDGAAVDDWTGACGIGADYLSQRAVVRLSQLVGEPARDGDTVAERVRSFLTRSRHADAVVRDIGTYLGWSTALYREFYGQTTLLLLGGITEGALGEAIAARAQAICDALGVETKIVLPARSGRFGQAVAAATLAVGKKEVG